MMEKEPLISIIVPVYNVSEYLDRSMETLVIQTYQNLEIILVNDGSKDNSGELCDIWAEKDSRIRVIHQKNGGPSRARNAALDVMSGEYVMFFDSDDLLSPEICSVLHDALKEGADIAICDTEHIFPNQSYSFQVRPDREEMTSEEAIRQIWYQKSFLPSACAKLYRSTLFDGIRFTPNLLFEDVDILHELFWRSEKIVYTSSLLYGYVHRENSITTSAFSLKDMDILKVADKILAFSQDKPELICAAESYVVTVALRIYLNAPEKPEFSEGIRRAEKLLLCYGKKVLKDRNIRKKNRYALRLYYGCKPLLRFAYKHINRWK